MIGTDVAIRNFYWAIPIVLLALFIYFHIYLQRLWEALAALPAVFPDGRRLDEKSHPWLLTDLVRRHLPRLQKKAVALSRLQTVISMILGYWIVPVTLAFIWWRLLPNIWLIGYYQAAMLAFLVGLALCFLRNRRKAFKDKPRKVGRIPHFSRWLSVGQGIPAGIVVGLLCCSLTFCLHVPAFLRGADLKGADLNGADLKGTDLFGANLKGANLELAHLEDTNLDNAHLEGANLWGAHLWDAVLWDANLQDARLDQPSLQGAELQGADLRGAYLQGANFEGAYLEDANLEGATVNDLNQLKDTVGAYKGSMVVLKSNLEK